MKFIQEPVQAFRPITIVLETQEDFDDLWKVIDYAFWESPCGSKVEEACDTLRKGLRGE